MKPKEILEARGIDGPAARFLLKAKPSHRFRWWLEMEVQNLQRETSQIMAFHLEEATDEEKRAWRKELLFGSLARAIVHRLSGRVEYDTVIRRIATLLCYGEGYAPEEPPESLQISVFPDGVGFGIEVEIASPFLPFKEKQFPKTAVFDEETALVAGQALLYLELLSPNDDLPFTVAPSSKEWATVYNCNQ